MDGSTHRDIFTLYIYTKSIVVDDYFSNLYKAYPEKVTHLKLQSLKIYILRKIKFLEICMKQSNRLSDGHIF